MNDLLSTGDDTKTQPTDDREKFDLSLQATIQTFREELSKMCPASPESIQQNNQDFPILPGDNLKDVRWRFVLYCLKLMQLLKESIERSMAEFKQSQKLEEGKTYGPTDAPPLSPDTLSFGQQKTILTALQFITCLGIVPNLEYGVGIPLENRSGFGQILGGSQKNPDEERRARLLQIIKVLMECVQQPSLGGLILSRHIGDLLAVLVQLIYSNAKKESTTKSTDKCPSEVTGPVSSTVQSDNGSGVNSKAAESESPNQPLFHSPADIACQSAITEGAGTECTKTDSRHCDKESNTPWTEHDEIYCKTQLDNLLTKTYQPGVVKELLLLQGGPGGGKNVATPKGSSRKNPLPRAPRWLTRICGQLLCDRIMQPNGVSSLLKAVLDVGGKGNKVV